jgi:hypothetical protein
MQFKDKFTSDGSYDRSTARLAAAGDTQPADAYNETYAATATESNKILLLATMHADVIHCQAVKSLHMSSFEITGAFLHVKLDKSNCTWSYCKPRGRSFSNASTVRIPWSLQTTRPPTT